MKRRKTRKQKVAKRSKRGFSPPGSDRAMARQSRHWPLLECRIAAEWRDTNQICQIIIARKSDKLGIVVAGVYIVDLACLGVKNAYAAVFRSEYEYRQELRERLDSTQTMINCELDLAAKIIDEGVKYARSLGFRPNKDIRDANLVLGEANPENCDEEIPLGGPEGKPMFIEGPHDDARKILRVLERKVGAGNFNYLMSMGGDDFFFDDEDADDLNNLGEHTVDFEE